MRLCISNYLLGLINWLMMIVSVQNLLEDVHDLFEEQTNIPRESNPQNQILQNLEKAVVLLLDEHSSKVRRVRRGSKQ